jgi:hypothetical protein
MQGISLMVPHTTTGKQHSSPFPHREINARMTALGRWRDFDASHVGGAAVQMRGQVRGFGRVHCLWPALGVHPSVGGLRRPRGV